MQACFVVFIGAIGQDRGLLAAKPAIGPMA
jgi:hypothetical protein